MDYTEELFRSIKLIVENEISKQKSTDTVIGTVIEKVESSDAYKVSYQNIEIIASSLGGVYKAGDSVYVLLPKGVLGDVKFIIGKTNDRTPTITQNGNGLSDSTLDMIQNIINDFTSWTSDNAISPIEKASLAIQWEQIKASYAEVMEQAAEYPYDISTVELEGRYKNLEDMILPILANMETTSQVDGELLRETLGNYLAEDTRVRLLVQEEIKKELVYKVNILSSNGTSFKNGIVNTILTFIAMRGRKVITDDLKASNVRWTKINGDGNEIAGTEIFAKNIAVTSDDVDVKQIYRVQIIVEDIIVAQEYITLVDLNDVENIKLSIKASNNTNQIFDPTSNTIIPDYTKENQVLTASILKGKDTITKNTTIEWFYDGEKIVSDGRFEVSGATLKILRNLTSLEKPAIIISCKASYYSSEYLMTLEDEVQTEFLFVSNGEEGEDGKDALSVNILSPYGNIIKNDDYPLLIGSLDVVLGANNITTLISNRKWFYKDDTINSSSPYYDEDAGDGWSLISDSNNLNGTLNGYKTNLLSMTKEAIDGSLTIMAIAYFEEYKGRQTATFFDYTDPLNVTIIGNPILKNGEPTSLRVEVFRGKEQITDLSNYTIIWTLELSNPQQRSLFGPVATPYVDMFPKYGESIIIEWSSIPDNSEVYVQVKIFENE